MVIFQLATTEATRFPYNMRSTSATRVTSFPFKGLRSLQGSIISKFPPQKKNTPISSGPPSGSLATPGIVKHSLLCQPCSFKVLHLEVGPNPLTPGSYQAVTKSPLKCHLLDEIFVHFGGSWKFVYCIPCCCI